MERAGRLRTAAVGIAAALLYSDWIGEAAEGGAAPRHGYVSELGALAQPHHLLFNSLDAACGALVVLLALELARLLAATPAHRLGCAALGLFGACVVADATMPMDCAPSLSAACARAASSGAVSWHEQGHTVSSVTECVALLASMPLLASMLRSARGWPRVARMWELAAPAATAVASYVALRALENHLVGTSERLMVCIFSAWLATLAVAALPPSYAVRIRARAAPASSTASSGTSTRT
jgi:hypothetical protein